MTTTNRTSSTLTITKRIPLRDRVKLGFSNTVTVTRPARDAAKK